MSDDEYYYNKSRSITFGEKKKGKTTKYIKLFSIYILMLLISVVLLYPIVKRHSYNKLKSNNKILLQELRSIKKEINKQELILNNLKLKDDSIYSSLFGIEPMSDFIYHEHCDLDSNICITLDTNKHLIIDTKYKLNELRYKIMAYRHRFKKIDKLSKIRSKRLSSIPAIQPIFNDSLVRVSSGFGYRIHPIYNIRKFHKGMDFIANKGTNVYATGDGVVKKVSTLRKGYGKYIIIKHDDGYSTLYAHLSKFNVYRGKKVKRGDIIGYVGNTGSSTGNHLHYEVRKNGRYVNPINYYFKDLTPDEYFKIIKISNKFKKSMD